MTSRIKDDVSRIVPTESMKTQAAKDPTGRAPDLFIADSSETFKDGSRVQSKTVGLCTPDSNSKGT